MNGYLLFAGNRNPKGGIDDLFGRFDSVSEAEDRFQRLGVIEAPYVDNWGQVVEYDTMTCVLYLLKYDDGSVVSNHLDWPERG